MFSVHREARKSSVLARHGGDCVDTVVIPHSVTTLKIAVAQYVYAFVSIEYVSIQTMACGQRFSGTRVCLTGGCRAGTHYQWAGKIQRFMTAREYQFGNPCVSLYLMITRMSILKTPLRAGSLVLAATLLGFVGSGFAQTNQYPGSWHKVSVPVYQVKDFDFIDSLNGVCLGEDASFATTTDGGHSWKYVTKDPNNLILTKATLGMIKCAEPGEAVVAFPRGGELRLDGSTTEYVHAFPSYNTISQKMYDSLYGFRFAQDADDADNPLDSARILVTHDGWASSDQFGEKISGGLASHITSAIWGALLVDSQEVWMGNRGVILHTTNAGVHWDTISPTKASDYTQWYDFTVRQGGKEIYAKAGNKPIDFGYSNDSGHTWQFDSAFGGRNVRMSLTNSETIWSLISNKAGFSVPIDLFYNVFSTIFSQTLAYSSDRGLNWNLDVTTFSHDTLEEMHWLDARHGWIASWGYVGGSSIWYYDADAKSGVNNSSSSKEQLAVFPNPVATILYADCPIDSVVIFDPLGRRCRVNQTGDGLDVSCLSPGIYFVGFGDNVIRAKFVKE